jgi:glutathione S-transferase
MLRIWGRLSSINVRKVVLAARWMNLEFERVDAGREYGIVQTPEYLGRNPNGLVPLMEDGDFQLWESNVIVRYLCAKHSPGALYPQDLRTCFDAERWMDWQQTTLNPAGREAFIQLVRTPAEKRDAKALAQSVAATQPLLDVLDKHLSQRAFMVGAAFTMADMPIACEMHRWLGLAIDHPTRPHLDRWYQNILGRPASRGVLDLPLS